MQKLYQSISEVSEIVDEEQYILRYWEKEFEQLKPKKNRGGNRIYSEKDVLIIKTIKKLLREEKHSIKGAKEQLNNLFDNPNEDSLTAITHKLNFKTTVNHSASANLFNQNEISLSRNDVEELYYILKDIISLLEK